MNSLQSAVFYDAVADQYTASYSEASPAGYALRVRQDRVLELLSGATGKVLDIGCGPGMLATELLERGLEYWGVDASPKMIELCARRHSGQSRVHLTVGDAARLPFPTGFFDAVLCVGVLDRLADRSAPLAEMRRLLKPHGRLVVSFANRTSPYAAWKNYVYYPLLTMLRPIYFRLAGKPLPPAVFTFAGGGRKKMLRPSLAAMYTDRNAEKLLAAYRVQVKEIAYYNFDVLLSPLDEILPALSLTLSSRLEALRFGSLRWLGTGFLVSGETV